jgi:hypothetical protein
MVAIARHYSTAPRNTLLKRDEGIKGEQNSSAVVRGQEIMAASPPFPSSANHHHHPAEEANEILQPVH